MSSTSEASPPPPARATQQRSRALDVLTAVLLGVVSVTTALGAWQASTWTRQAADFGESSSDARDQNITRSIDWQSSYRLDTAAMQQARKYALLEDQANQAGDFRAEAFANVMMNNYLGRTVEDSLRAAFDTWRENGFPVDEAPTSDPRYVADLRGDADSYTIVSSLAGGFKDTLNGKAAILTQAALVDALALFLFGVAGINRLRSARFATLALGAAAYLASLIMMVTAF